MKLKVKNNKILEATCDICGEDCMIPIYVPMKSDGDRDDHDIIKEFEGMELIATWGYCSKKDGEEWNAVICEKCVDDHLTKIVNFIKIPYF